MKHSYSYRLEPNAVILQAQAELRLPMALAVNGEARTLTLSAQGPDFAEFSCPDASARLAFDADCVRIAFQRRFPAETPIYESVLFAGGIRLTGFDRALTTQPRNNGGLNMDIFAHLPDVSANGYFSPPQLNMILGSPDGWAAVGLLDLPDSKLCRLNPDMSLLAESCGGSKRAVTYRAPELLVTFPTDEWQAVSLFRDKLIEYGRFVPEKPAFSQVPAWWKDPLICTYGDQLIQDRVGQLIDDAWTTEFVEVAERDWGIRHMNLVIDDSWQPCQSFAPRTDPARFPDMRAFTDRMHARGHRVILWTQPLFDNVGNGFEPLSRKYGLLTDCPPSKAMGDYYKGSYMIDYTADNARAFLREVCQGLFGDGEGQFNADGVKLDFMGTLRDPAQTQTYAHPERGVGIRELYRFYQLFSEEARRVKPDVLIDCTVGDPRFEAFITHNRLHDTHAGVEEKELRARLSSLSCPDLLMDSDGALMYASWLRNHYVSAAVYAVPSNYYLRGFQDFHSWNGAPGISREDALHHDLTPSERLAFGTLFAMTALRPDGHPVMEDFGCWKLVDDAGQVNAVSLRGDTVLYYPEKPGDTGYLFSFRDETQILPLYGRRISPLTPSPWRDYLQVDYARDRFFVHPLPGVLYRFRWEDTAPSIDRAFAASAAGGTEGETNYVNG